MDVRAFWEKRRTAEMGGSRGSISEAAGACRWSLHPDALSVFLTFGKRPFVRASVRV